MKTHNFVLIEEALTRSVIGAFYIVYQKLGYGFLEAIYAAALEKELIKRGHKVRREVGIPIFYDGGRIGFHRMDMLVDDRLVVEIKSTEILATAANRQLRSYVKATALQVGLLFHFGPKPKFYREVSTSFSAKSAPSA